MFYNLKQLSMTSLSILIIGLIVAAVCRAGTETDFIVYPDKKHSQEFYRGEFSLS